MRSKVVASLTALILVALSVSGCQPKRRSEIEAEKQPETVNEPEARAIDVRDIDIGDVTYGVYTSIEFSNANVRPNIDVKKLKSPRFDRRTQLLTLNISPPHPTELTMAAVIGSTRPMDVHTVYLNVDIVREYQKADGEVVEETIQEYTTKFGGMYGSLKPEIRNFDPLAGLETLPESILIKAELEGWLFLHTDWETFDPETADFDSAKTAKWPGFNPARINLVTPGG